MCTGRGRLPWLKVLLSREFLDQASFCHLNSHYSGTPVPGATTGVTPRREAMAGAPPPSLAYFVVVSLVRLTFSSSASVGAVGLGPLVSIYQGTFYQHTDATCFGHQDPPWSSP